MRRAKWFIIPAVILAACAGAYYWFRATAHVSISYCVEAQFTALPADDKALSAWLANQPGVVAHTVHIGRHGVGGRLLKVGFIQVRNLLGQPPFPDLESRAPDLGYEGLDGPFRDCVDR
jgi:hypothetical protein